ncbi:MAG: hypothetical protein IPO56_16205 [Flavobacteriales bacterium]|nr:hypothetical protein [Flavobacteriales bacterium]
MLPLPLLACTAFVMHKDGRTFIGNNEDSWCIQGRVRFRTCCGWQVWSGCTSAAGPDTRLGLGGSSWA